MHEDFNASVLPLQSGIAEPSLADFALPQIYLPIKRTLDIALTIAVGPIALLIVLLLAAVVALDGHAPFYCQPRLGRAGRHFRLWKLRSMVQGAEGKLSDYLASNPTAREEWDRTQKLQHDPRITPVGRLMRKYSLDELPQLWNVLRGDMSLVGPRPMFPEQRSIYPGSDYFSLRPGITGLWQVTARNKSSFAERAVYDSEYAHRLSAATDVRILILTPIVMLRGTGA